MRNRCQCHRLAYLELCQQAAAFLEVRVGLRPLLLQLIVRTARVLLRGRRRTGSGHGDRQRQVRETDLDVRNPSKTREIVLNLDPTQMMSARNQPS